MTNGAHDEDMLRSKLRSAADAAGAIEPLNVADLVNRRRRRPPARGLLIVVGVVAIVAALAVVPRALTHSTGHKPASSSPPTSALPGYVGPKVTVSALTSYTWRALPPAPIAGRYGEASAWTGTSMIVWGGTSGNDVLGDGAAYDPSSRTWTTLPAAPLSARVGPSGGWAGTFIVWGGRSAGQQELTDGARYDPRTKQWAPLPRAPITSWAQQQLVVAGDRVVLLTTPPGRTATTIRATSYDPARNTWNSLPDLVTPKNHDVDQLVTLGVGTAVFVWSEWAHTVGDARGAGTTTSYGVDAYRLDTAAATWSTAPVKPGGGLTASNPLWTGQRILLPQDGRYCGGCAGPPLSDPRAISIDPRTGARTDLPTGPVSGTYSWTGGAVIAVNASSTGGAKHLRPGDTTAYDPVSHRWTKLAGQPANTFADEAIQFWTGDRLIVWGLDLGHKSTHARGAEFVPVGG